LGSPPPANSVIGFRLDDVQEGYCVAQQKEVINLFIEKGVPLTIGLIGHAMSEKTADMAAFLNTATVKDAVAAGIIEIGNHSFAHQNMGAFTEEAVKADLEQAQAAAENITGVQPQSFVPPENAFTFAQLSGAFEPGIRVLSSQCAILEGGGLGYCPPVDGGESGFVKAPDIFHSAGGDNKVALLPIGCVIGGQAYFNDFAQPADYDEAMGWAERQVGAAGYALYMLHPQEFANDPPSCGGGMDDKKIEILGEILDTYASGGYRLGGMTKMVADLTGGS